MHHDNLPQKRHLVWLTRAAGAVPEQALTPAPAKPVRAPRILAGILHLAVVGVVAALITVLCMGQLVPAAQAQWSPQTTTGAPSYPRLPQPPFPPLSPPPITHAGLQAVAAISATDVWAVGYGVRSAGGVQQPLIEDWNGQWWNVVPSPQVGAGADTGALAGVAAISARDVWAVGSITHQGSNGTQSKTLVEHWNGRVWSVVPSPNASGGSISQLHSVAAVSSGDVWAVGSSTDPDGTATLVEHWNGSMWSIVACPGGVPGHWSRNYLTGVTAISGTDVWAVGYSQNYQGYSSSTMVVHWNGSQWAVVPSADTSSLDDYLTGVAAVASNNLWAVGYTGGGYEGSSQTLIEQWDGQQWSIVSSPNTTNPWNDLAGVAVVSASDLWAVGTAWLSNGPTYSLTEQWDGSHWNLVPNPAAESGVNPVLGGVAAVSASDVWAVGSIYNPATVSGKTLVEHWNGSQWQVVPSP